MINLERLRSAFETLSPAEPRLFSAPGRVNLIGEHTDYNQGFVLPMAANLRTYVAAAPRDNQKIKVHSVNLNETVSFDLVNRDTYMARDHWSSYIQGVCHTLAQAGLPISGADLAILSEVPIGGGLSSSAALEISVGFAVAELANWKVDLKDLALAGQKAEHEFVGTNSGLMDQLTAAFAKKDYAMLIDCRSFEIKQIPVDLQSLTIVTCNTGVKHSLVNSAYNQRRQECENAATMLGNKKPGVRSLRDLEMDDLNLIEQLPDPQRRRARHVVTENARTIQAAKALATGDGAGLGKLMSQSHESLRDDFEVSCYELDVMVEIAKKQDYVLGARLMGGGFGGSTINLIEREQIDAFTASMTNDYKQATGMLPLISTVQADEGVNELSF